MQRVDQLLKVTSVRLAALQTCLFLVMFAIAAGSAVVVLRRAEVRAARAEIEQTEDDLSRNLQVHGLQTFLTQWPSLVQDSGVEIRLEDASGRRIAGRLPPIALPRPTPRKVALEFSLDHPPSPSRPNDRFVATNHAEPAGMRLTVAENLTVRQRQNNPLLLMVAAVAMLTAILGAGAGLVAGYGMLRRLDHMAGAVGAYAGGDRSARVAVSERTDTDLDHLARALNQMMERENRLVEGLRQVSSAIAHDLRRPLAHHNQEISAALQQPPSVEAYRLALEAAAKRVDDVLQTFQALLHIAELEAGAPGLELAPVDLNAVAARMVQAYAPLAEVGERSLRFVPANGTATIMGEQRALGRMIANIVDNALIHTPGRTSVEVRVDAEGPRLTVSDDGPGVPKEARDRLFERFFRLDASRSTPGSGLGLALAAATAQAFGGRLSAEDAHPGLRIVADFARR